jgi:hypothetical protein
MTENCSKMSKFAPLFYKFKDLKIQRFKNGALNF